MERIQNLSREDFMAYFRDDEKLNKLTADDRVEIFRTILAGSSDITKKLFDEILSDYCVRDIEVIELTKENASQKKPSEHKNKSL